jgi:hypothetical protein
MTPTHPAPAVRTPLGADARSLTAASAGVVAGDEAL